MPLAKFNVHFIRVVAPDDPKTRDYIKCVASIEAFRPVDAEQQVRERELSMGYGFIRGKVKVDLREAYAKRGARR